ncbi:MAG TPA: hypothetical protein VEH62_09485 [Gemmatimonadales bacterium]|nr:hypothetical protein [Gemmatimonadales bacterium]
MTADQKARDWDKELAQIDKLIASGAGQASPPAAAPAGAPAPAPRGAASPAPAGPRPRAVVFTWLRLLLGLAVGVGITQWPYARGCGVLLFGYLGAVAGVIVAGLWSTISSWRTRSGFAHVLSLALVCWGAVLGARELLPRVGYARARATWLCPVGGTTPPSAPAAPAAPARTPAATQPPGAF